MITQPPGEDPGLGLLVPSHRSLGGNPQAKPLNQNAATEDRVRPSSCLVLRTWRPTNRKARPRCWGTFR